MSGLNKPRGRPAARRAINPAINSKASGGMCGGNRGNGGSLFVSSYHEDKERKHRQQMKDRMKKYLLYGAVGLVLFVVSRSSNDEAARLRSSGTVANANAVPAPPTTPRPTNKPTEAPKKCAQVTTVVKDTSSATPVSLAMPGTIDAICGRKLPVPLTEGTEKPSPLGPNKPPADGKEAILLRKDSPFGGWGTMLNVLFHAYDLAYETKRPIYVTKDSWVFTLLYPLFLGPSSAVAKDDMLWATAQQTLRVKVIENAEELTASGITVPDYWSPTKLFYRRSTGVEPAQIRDHRNAILRMLFRFSSAHGKPNENVCSPIEALLGEDKAKKYTAISILSPSARNYMSKLMGETGRDHSGAADMTPDYVKNILKRLDMLDKDIYPIGDGDLLAHDKLARDPDIGKNLKCSSVYGGGIYLAVLADVYLGNPVDQESLWIARLRLALGFKNTFVFTEKKGGEWVPYVDDDLWYYNPKKLGIWTG